MLELRAVQSTGTVGEQYQYNCLQTRGLIVEVLHHNIYLLDEELLRFVSSGCQWKNVIGTILNIVDVTERKINPYRRRRYAVGQHCEV